LLDFWLGIGICRVPSGDSEFDKSWRDKLVAVITRNCVMIVIVIVDKKSLLPRFSSDFGKAKINTWVFLEIN